MSTREAQRRAQAALRARRAAQGLCYVCAGPRDRDGLKLCSVCARRNLEHQREGNRKAWLEIKSHYGASCACCGESNDLFLTLDHINNDGYLERASGDEDYRTRLKRYIRDGWPADLQVLCMNCNFGKMRNGGVCPHRTGQ